MRIRLQLAAVAAFGLMASLAQAEGQGFGRCKTGFEDGTKVNTASRGELSIGQVRANDRVWSFNEVIGKAGWSKVLRRVDAGPHYTLFVDFTEPDTGAVTKACWHIRK